MKFHELLVSKNKQATRVGRGIAAGKGKTAGRGTKGQGARKSGGVRPGFEGGQMPLYLRIPKLRGFTSKRTPATNIYTGQLQELGKTVVDTHVLTEAGLIEHPHLVVKIVVNGSLSKKMTVKLQGASVQAIAMIKKAGGQFEKVEQVKRPAKKDQSKKQ